MFKFVITAKNGKTTERETRIATQDAAHRAVREMIKRDKLAVGTTVAMLDSAGDKVELFTVKAKGTWTYDVLNGDNVKQASRGGREFVRIGVTLWDEAMESAA